MPAKTWQHVVVQAPIRRAHELLPDEIADGANLLDIRHESTAESAFWGKDSRRYRAVWTGGRRTGRGYVELRPHASTTSEVVVHLEAPSGFLGRLLWDTNRINRTALGLALALRFEMDASSELRTAKAARSHARGAQSARTA